MKIGQKVTQAVIDVIASPAQLSLGVLRYNDTKHGKVVIEKLSVADNDGCVYWCVIQVERASK